MSTAREEILTRIRTAITGAPPKDYAQVPHDYRRSGTLERDATLDLFKDRLLDYDSEILEVATEAEIAAAIAQALTHADERRFLVAEAFPKQWLPANGEPVLDSQLTAAQMDGISAVVTTCEAAIASTGTIILVHEGAQGRRAITLLPDHHVCVVARSQVYEIVPQAVVALAERSRNPITTISGPSATSDIEMTRIRGVHGPRYLSVVLYG